MQKIGNIITKSKSISFEDYFNVVDNIEQIDNKLPTLIIGYSLASNIIPNFSITRETYDNDMFWCFSPRERRSLCYLSIEKFRQFSMLRFLDCVDYQYINFTCYTLSKIKKLIEYINSRDKKLFYYIKRSNFLFFYSNRFHCVWGLSLSLCEYLGISSDKIIEKIRYNKKNKFITDFESINDIIKIIGVENPHNILPIYDIIKR